MEVWADSGEVHGLVRPAGLSVLDELLPLSRRVEGLKYQEGATKVVGVAFEVERLRTSSSWYPCRSCVQRISVSDTGSTMMLSRMLSFMGMVFVK